MPNKKAISRYVILERLLSSSVNYTYKKLLNDLNKNIESEYSTDMIIQERQLKYDLDEMKTTYGLEFDNELLLKRPAILKKTNKHKLLSFDNELPREYLDNLKQVSLLLNPISGSKISSDIIEFIAKVDETILSESDESIISFYSNQYSEGLNYLNQIINSIKNKEVIKISYQTKNNKQTYTASPYYLKQSKKGTWHLFCKAKSKNKILNLNLNFIKKISALPKEPYVGTSINFNEYFDDIIDIAVPWNRKKKSQEIVLAIRNKYIRYLDSNPLHPSQTRKNQIDSRFNINKSEYSIRYYKIIPTTELVKYLLGFGNDIIVLSPKKLVDRIRNDLKDSLNNYQTL